MNTSKWAFAAMLAVVFSTVNAADRDSIALSHYEPLHQLEMRTVSARAANALVAGGSGPMVMSFAAMGRSFDLELELNSRVIAAARQNPLLSGMDIYRGEIAGKPGSWARIVVADGMPRGMFWDGQDLYAIEAPGDSIVDATGPVIFRLADMHVAPGSMSCGSASVAMTAAGAFENLVGELGSMSEAQGAVEEIGMGMIGDFEFTSAKGGDAAAAAAITTRMNNVDGIFSSQLGVQITVNTIETFNNAADPFTDESDAGMLLDEVSDYRLNTPAQNSNGLTHLFTGRDLAGTTVGIAWTSALCSARFGAGLSEGNGTATFDSLVAAHEIGHNFGAPHDGETGSACESQAGEWLMSPRLNGESTFSPCTIDQVTDDIARASCITALPAIDMAVGLQSASSILFGADADLSFDVVNNGTLDATNVTADFTIPSNLTLGAVVPSAGTCTTVSGTVSCALGDVPGLGNRTVDITVTPNALGTGLVNATVSADVDDRPSNNQDSQQVSVDPAVDLVVDRPTGSSVRIDRSTTITAALQNTATLDATGVTLTVAVGAALQTTDASWSLGSCTVLAQQVTCQAATFPAQSSSTISVTATGISEGSPRITVSLGSAEADLVPGDNTATNRVEVRQGSDDSGSGSTGPLFLLLLGLVALVRRRF